MAGLCELSCVNQFKVDKRREVISAEGKADQENSSSREGKKNLIRLAWQSRAHPNSINTTSTQPLKCKC